jgi:hypothetical protein
MRDRKNMAAGMMTELLGMMAYLALLYLFAVVLR